MNSTSLVGAGVLLLIIGILLLTGILQTILTFVGGVGIIVGVIVVIVGLVKMAKGGDTSY
jgi:hypothetical protein